MNNLEQMQTAWDRYAEAYDTSITPFSMRVAEDALRIAGAKQGIRLLDIAAGGGALSIPAARLGANVLATDFSPAMMRRLEQKADEENLSNLQVKTMNGTALELDDNSFDMVCSQLGIMLFPDRHKGLQEMARVTKPEGKGVMVVFGPPDQVQFFAVFFQALRETEPSFTPPLNSPLFCLQSQDDLYREMSEAGFNDVHVETVHHFLEVKTGEHLWTMIKTSTPAIAALLSQFTDEQQTAAQAKVEELLRTRFEDNPIKLSAAFNIGIGMQKV